MGEILFVCGSNKKAVIATLSVVGHNIEESEGSLTDEVSWFEACTGAPVWSSYDFWVILISNYVTEPLCSRVVWAL